MDRGVASYSHPLAADDAGEFLTDPLKGWGQPMDPDTPHAYSRIAALPSATLTVSGADDEITRFHWQEVTETRTAERDDVRVSLVESGRNWVHVRVLDAETDRPVPCRVHFRSPEGVPYQRYGHHDHVNSDLGTWHVDVGGDSVSVGSATRTSTGRVRAGSRPATFWSTSLEASSTSPSANGFGSSRVNESSS